mgnify:CR=1 FL=1|jgi:hypothetical protein
MARRRPGKAQRGHSASGWYGAQDAACPVSTGRRTRRIRLVRGATEGQQAADAPKRQRGAAVQRSVALPTRYPTAARPVSVPGSARGGLSREACRRLWREQE